MRLYASTFYFREMCANFLIWDATGVKARRARHTGAVVGVVREFREELQETGAVLTTRELDAFEVAKTTRFVPEGAGERDAAVQRLVREFIPLSARSGEARRQRPCPSPGATSGMRGSRSRG